MRQPLWVPSEERVKKSNITRFIKHVNEKHSLNIGSYVELYNWSVENAEDFWEAMWSFAGIKYSRKYDFVVDDLEKFPGANWFVGAQLNIAENLLRRRDDSPAIIFRGEGGRRSSLTYKNLYHAAAGLAKPLREMGVAPRDRVAAYMPNIPCTVIAMLAATSLGASWSSCGAELGPQAVIDRLGQIKPKVLFTVDGYLYKGKSFNVLPNVEKIVKEISSIEKVIVYPYVEKELKLAGLPIFVNYDDFRCEENGVKIVFEQLPSNHPLYIMFSSGTTGTPKCMVQGAAGVLINHLKELLLHTDLKSEDRITYITSPSWMMWNWLISSLAVGAAIVLYDGNPVHPMWNTMWEIVQEEKISVFGCSATYINYLRSLNAEVGRKHDLSSLREISQTGSPLSPEGFEYVYAKIKRDLHFNSISGGTDINGCFAAGSPVQPVYAGELQSAALGMKIKAYDEGGCEVVDKQAELVCELPSPSMPLYFWNDPEMERYGNTYFKTYPNVWRHGDWIVIHGDTGGITFLGRSDFTLKPSGVRIGPAEIYNVVEKISEVADSLAVAQRWKGDQRIILFVKLAQRQRLTEELKGRIKKALREDASPRHVPALILEAPDIPYTFSMKKVESAVSNIINGQPVTNRDALTNPESLKFYENLKIKG